MRKVILFVEDFGHEEFLKALLDRLAEEYEMQIEIIPRSVRGGHGKVIAELQEYLRDLEIGNQELPDLLVVATDGNCKGHQERKQEITEEAADLFKDLLVCAIPDPHIERWLLLDSSAFKEVLGRGCDAPDYKCERDRYKGLLIEAIQQAGISPLVGGIEHAADIVKQMDLQRMERADDSLGKLLKDLRHKLNQWSRT
ncbi:MAG: DUF4276 family protein [Blastocatellia bacterium]|nr:DUF4276 family protein [Blastocatellia bacterium]